MQQHFQGDLTYFTAAALAGQPVQHAILGRHGGSSSAPFGTLNLSSAVGDAPATIAANRARAYGLFGRDQASLVHAHLKHGAHVARVGMADHGQIIADADGLISDEPGTGLTMNFADCGSILLYDPQHHAIGLGHAGWRGAIADLPGALVRAMQTAYGSNPADLIAALGPCISVSRYEVDEPVISAVNNAFPKWHDRLLVYQTGDDGVPLPRPHLNLALANHIRLYEAGVKQVELPQYCTASRTDLFFSHRAERGRTGRFGALLILQPHPDGNV